jgi:hypothetical protein
VFPVLLKSQVSKKNYVMLDVFQVQKDFYHVTITISMKGKSSLKFYGYTPY